MNFRLEWPIKIIWMWRKHAELNLFDFLFVLTLTPRVWGLKLTYWNKRSISGQGEGARPFKKIILAFV